LAYPGFAEALYIGNLVVKIFRVPFLGSVGANGRPLESKRGQLFEQSPISLRALGYNVEWRIPNCADFGDPTTGGRLVVIRSRARKSHVWNPHAFLLRLATPGLREETRKPGCTDLEIIDRELLPKRMFDRKKPTSPPGRGRWLDGRPVSGY
jgi:DNA (cytosine-5)-methyltransferase 1